MSEKEADLDAVKTFFDPHPGMMGAAAPIPDAVRKVANELNGQKFSLREAVSKIKAVTSGEVKVYKDCIMLSIRIDVSSAGYIGHVWRVIKFRD